MAAIIYMEQTLALIHKEQGPEAVQEIVQSGLFAKRKVELDIY